jgi:ParB family transcriptional regulator, chromosome partitioning protein
MATNKQALSNKFKERVGRDPFFGTSTDLHQVIEVDLDRLRPNPHQPRTQFDEDFIRELADSIREKGLIQPISVGRDEEKPNHYIIYAGEQRYRAFTLLGRDTIPAILTSGDPAEIAVIENVQRRDLHPLDEARSYAVLMERHGYTQEQLGKVVHKSRSTITEFLSLNSLPEYIKEECRTSDIPKSTLIEIARIDDENAQREAWEGAKTGTMSVRAARQTKKSSSPAAKKKGVAAHAAGNRAVASAQAFLKHLRDLNEKQDSLDPGTLESLWQASGEIHSLLSLIAEKGSQNNGG